MEGRTKQRSLFYYPMHKSTTYLTLKKSLTRESNSKLYNLKHDSHMGTLLGQAIDSFLSSINLSSLSDSPLWELNLPFSEGELAQVNKTLPNGKSPSLDRFSNEYIKLYQNTLIPHLCSLFNQAMSEGREPLETLQVTIVTLLKPDNSPDTPANFRPISLLNSDIKLYAKALERRLLLDLPTLINADQVGFIKGCQVPDGTRCLLNILSHAESSKIPTVFLSLDAEKAFDRIH